VPPIKRIPNASVFLKTGFRHGIVGGFLSSLAFIILAFVIVIVGYWIFPSDVTTNYFDMLTGFALLSLIVLIIGALLGVLPAVIIGAVFGIIMGLCFYLTQGYLFNRRRALFLGAFLGLAVALPLIAVWVSFLVSSMDLSRFEFNKRVFLILLPFCVGAGIYLGWKLHKMMNGSPN